jgi:hypothetical protein
MRIILASDIEGDEFLKFFTIVGRDDNGTGH